MYRYDFVVVFFPFYNKMNKKHREIQHIFNEIIENKNINECYKKKMKTSTVPYKHITLNFYNW